jgi:hypothetical protein
VSSKSRAFLDRHWRFAASTASALLALPLAVHATGSAVPAGPAPGAAVEVGTYPGGAPLYRLESLSPVFTIDRIYKSMQGPDATETRVLVDDRGSPELLWMVGYEATVTDTDGQTPKSAEFMCHSSADTSAAVYRRSFPTSMALHGNRLFSVDQGTTGVRFPKGFGIPILSNQVLAITTQVLNHNLADVKLDVRQRVTIDFVRHRSLAQPFRPLIQHGVFGMVLVEGADGHLGIDPGMTDPAKHGPGCSLGTDVGDPRGVVRDPYGRQFSSFWMVEPGRHDYHTRVTALLALPYDTTLHFAAAHLHPYAESLELVDLTAGKTVVKLQAHQTEGKIGLARVENFSSETGVPLYRDHEYDLVARYDNTSGSRQDAMATMLLYVLVRDLVFVPFAEASGEKAWRPFAPGPLGAIAD